MIRLPKLTSRQILIVLHDLLATAAAIVLTFFVLAIARLMLLRLEKKAGN